MVVLQPPILLLLLHHEFFSHIDSFLLSFTLLLSVYLFSFSSFGIGIVLVQFETNFAIWMESIHLTVLSRSQGKRQNAPMCVKFSVNVFRI